MKKNHRFWTKSWAELPLLFQSMIHQKPEREPGPKIQLAQLHLEAEKKKKQAHEMEMKVRKLKIEINAETDVHIRKLELEAQASLHTSVILITNMPRQFN